MKLILQRFLWLLLCLLPLRLVHAQEFLPPEQAFAFSAQMDGNQAVRVNFKIAPNYYMYRDEFAFSIVSPDGSVVQNGAVKLPAAQIKFDENFNQDMAIYHNSVTAMVPVKKMTADEALFKVVVTSRGCADKGLCYPPRKTQAVLTFAPTAAPTAKVEVKPIDKPVPTEKIVEKTEVLPEVSTRLPSLEAAQANAAAFDNSAYARDVFKQHSFLIALAVFFGLGILLSLTPCMLPMFPILSAILAGQTQVSRGRGFLLALTYVTGMAMVYALIGVIAAQSGAGLHRYLQNPWVLGMFALILALLALSLFDVFQLQLPASWQVWLTDKTQGKKGYWGAAIFGAASALIASPCVTAPLVGVIAYISQTGNIALGAIALFVLAYGMGLPLLLLGAGFGQLLPKGGAWMVRIKQAIGVLMLIAALWVAQPLWGKYWQAMVAPAQTSSAFQPIANVAQLDQALAQSDKPILLDLYADWCRSCIEMERKTFSDPQVQQAMQGMTLLRVDMTQYTDDHAVLLQKFNLYGPPAVIILAPMSGQEEARVIGFEAPELFLTRLKP